MKTVIIGDIHGHDLWKQVVAQEHDADRFIFVGDYFDSFTVSGVVQIHNFKEIVEFKTTSLYHDVIMLIGNHDYHYFPEIGDSNTSGYQSTLAPSIKQVIGENKQHLQMGYKFDDIVCTHAGLSSEWLDDTFVDWNVDNMIDKLNELFQYQPKKVDYRSFKYYDYENNQAQLAGGFGAETFQGPIWIRPDALMKSNYDTLRTQIRQVVGHTTRKQIDIEGKSTGGRYYFIDTMPREYLIVNDGVVSLGKLENEKIQTK
jgi:UDP-2,3-diacylglucosamine pyrophosphatase LpxH